MKFVDVINISVSGGRGGNGCMSFRREKFLPNGGPDGGNGGRGGDVVLEATANIQTLADFEHRRRFVSENGEHGSGNARNGKSGARLTLPVPCGTIVYDAVTGEGVADLVEPGDTYMASMGGRGGRGNRVFASSRRRAPRFSEKGEAGEERRLKLELKLIADIGLVGLPNAGKSSILAAVSGATPKIADYPFTTLSPNLGVLRTDVESIVLADIPGLIEGASDDRGLGLAFLRHIERTRLILHVLDVSSCDAGAIIGDFEVVRGEMERYDPGLGSRPCVVICNKIDQCGGEDELSRLEAEMSDYFGARRMEFVSVSALCGSNMPELVRRIVAFSAEHPRPKGEVRMFASLEVQDRASLVRSRLKVQIVSLPGGGFRVLHPQVERAAERYDLSQEENVARFTRLLRKHRVEELLSAAGAVSGASVSIGRVEFDFHPDEDYGSVISDDNERYD
ncbi:MAG: GTPase ObgE [Synergistaceae bacterium]|jgi:GTP-binding protein|nr:GTPase ObgE [Synergistaceae bacterium]